MQPPLFSTALGDIAHSQGCTGSINHRDGTGYKVSTESIANKESEEGWVFRYQVCMYDGGFDTESGDAGAVVVVVGGVGLWGGVNQNNQYCNGRTVSWGVARGQVSSYQQLPR